MLISKRLLLFDVQYQELLHFNTALNVLIHRLCFKAKISQMHLYGCTGQADNPTSNISMYTTIRVHAY